MTSYMLDTDICSFVMRKVPKPSKRLMQLAPRHEIFISVITYFELRKGALANKAPKSLNAATTAFVAQLTGVLPWDKHAAESAVYIDSLLSAVGRTIGPNDVMIAGHALVANCVLVTHNMREFGRAKELTCEDWM
jgi:tRNA(fMet)-specific endonuclease VapC